MNEYETLFIIGPQSSEGDRNQLNERFEGIVKKHGGGTLFNRFLGRKKLSYPIKKSKEGYYYAFNYVSKPTVIEELEKVMRYDEMVLRFLTIKKNDEVEFEKRLTEVKTKGEDKAPIIETYNRNAKFEEEYEDEEE